MGPATLNRVVRHLRHAAISAGPTDGELLQAFVHRRDEAAFAGLVHRHAAMVLGVCRRVLRNEADAEDAFQATFLVLIRKAASIRTPSSVSNWLYGVAHTTALKAKAMNRKRLVREREAGALPRHEASEEVWRAVQAILDAELVRLPDKYRRAIVQCDLEGKTIKEAARQLACPQGTLATHLARGRALLARRLARHGLVLSAGALTAALTHGASAAAVPPALLVSTVKTTGLLPAGQAATAGLVSAKVAALTQGVVQAMFLTQLKSSMIVTFVVVALGAGVGAICHGTSAQEAGSLPQAGKQVQADPRLALKQEIERLRAELARTQLELQKAKAEIALLKAEAQLAQARAEEARLQALVAAGQAKQGVLAPPKAANPLILPPTPAKPDFPPAADPLPKAKQPDPVPNPTVTSPDGRTVIVAEEKTIVALDARTGQIIWKSLGHFGPVTAVAFTPDGKIILSSGMDSALNIWDVATGKQIRRITSPPATSIQFDNTARMILLTESNGTRRLIDPATGKELRVDRDEKAK